MRSGGKESSAGKADRPGPEEEETRVTLTTTAACRAEEHDRHSGCKRPGEEESQ